MTASGVYARMFASITSSGMEGYKSVLIGILGSVPEADSEENATFLDFDVKSSVY